MLEVRPGCQGTSKTYRKNIKIMAETEGLRTYSRFSRVFLQILLNVCYDSGIAQALYINLVCPHTKQYEGWSNFINLTENLSSSCEGTWLEKIAPWFKHKQSGFHGEIMPKSSKWRRQCICRAQMGRKGRVGSVHQILKSIS